jgi:hypothetical protein
MYRWFSCFAALAWSLLGSHLLAEAGEADVLHLVVIEPSSGSVLSKGAKEHLRAAIAEVVMRNGITLVPSSTLPDRLLRCELPGCLPQIAAASGAALVLSVEAQFAKESFKLTIRLWNADEGKLLGSDGRDCPICDEQDLWGSAALLTQGLIERARREPSKAPVAIPLVAAAAPPVSSPAPLSVAPVDPQAPSNHPGPFVTYSGFALAAAGLAALVVGSYYISVDGDRACSQCARVRDTSKYGWPIAAAGGAALLGGAGLVAWSFWPDHATVAVGPTSVFVAGRFR